MLGTSKFLIRLLVLLLQFVARLLVAHQLVLGTLELGTQICSLSLGDVRCNSNLSRPSGSRVGVQVEIEVLNVPLQLALAYAAVANGGVLMHPMLVREIRDRDGRVHRAHVKTSMMSGVVYA